MKNQNKLFIRIFCVMILWQMSNHDLYAQEISFATKRNHAWLTFGVGANTIGFAYGWGFSYQTGKGIFSIRNVKSVGMLELLYSANTNTKPLGLFDIAILYGVNTRKVDERGVTGFASLSAGLSILTATSRKFTDSNLGGYNEVKNRTIGLALEGQLLWIPAKTWGLGLYGFGNIYSEGAFFGVLLTTQFGVLK